MAAAHSSDGNEKSGPRASAAALNSFDADAYSKAFDSKAIELDRSSLEWLPPALRRSRRLTRDFARRVWKRWGGPLERLQAIVLAAEDVGDRLNRHLRGTADGDRVPDVVEATTRVHARCLRTAREIGCLLENGFADGALGRWRTLHELSLTSMVIAAHGDAVARRFLDHATIHQANLSRRYAEHAHRIGFEPIDQSVAAALFERESDLLAKYGKNFNSDFGWATPATGNDRTSLSHLEDLCGLTYLRPFTRDSSDNIHASAKGTLLPAGLSETLKTAPSEHDQTLLSGASDEGLADSIQLTSLSLINATRALASLSSDPESRVALELLEIWHERLKHDLGEVDGDGR